ncbi:MAG: histidine kinase dimerization/phospho-acceptor domain-containing protein, partial [Pseudomonadota bacterium]
FQSVLEPTTEVIHLPGGVAWRMTAIPHADGGLVLIYEDATDTLGLERDVNILLDVRRATIDHLLEGVAVFGADGRLKLYNPAFQRLWRLTPMTLAHEPHVLDVAGDAQAFFSGDGDWSAFRDWMSEAVFERQYDTGRWDRIDGSRVEFVVTPLPDGNVMLAFLDVTDALQERRELQKADRLRSRFEGNLAREIRRPTEAILGFAEVLTDAAAGALNEDQQRYAGAIVGSAARLMDLLDEVETLAAIEAEDFTLERRPTPLAALLADACADVRQRADRAQVTLELDCGAALEAEMFAVDPGRLRQAVANFLIDALRRTPPEGIVRLSADVDADGLSIAIVDDGYSIRPAERDPVYDAAEDAPYLAGAVSRDAPGTLPLFPDLADAEGPAAEDEPLWTELGLRLATRLIEAHGGTTSLRRDRPRGGETVCRLPIAAAPMREAAAAE